MRGARNPVLFVTVALCGLALGVTAPSFDTDVRWLELWAGLSGVIFTCVALIVIKPAKVAVALAVLPLPPSIALWLSPADSLEIWDSGNPRIWKYGIQKIQKMRILRMHICSAQNVGKVQPD